MFISILNAIPRKTKDISTIFADKIEFSRQLCARTGFFSTNKILAALTALADPVKVVEITADVIPEPATTSVQHDAILLAVVVVRLVLAPGWPLHDLACNVADLL